MRAGSLLILLLLVVVLPSTGAEAQEPPVADTDEVVEVMNIELYDGSVLIGTIVRDTDEEIVVVTIGGSEVVVRREQIRRMRPVTGRIEEGRLIPFDPNRTRLLFSPTARPLGRGEGYFAVYQIFLPFVAYGISDEISIAGGTVLLPGAFGRVFYVAPKVTFFERDLLTLGVGGVGLGVFIEGESTTAGIGYGLVTYGTRERAFTVGVGAAFADGEMATGALVMLGGELQVGRSIKLMTENYLLPLQQQRFDPATFQWRSRTSYEPVFSVGVRFFGPRLAVDLAGFTYPELLGEGFAFPFIPWVGFAYNFGG